MRPLLLLFLLPAFLPGRAFAGELRDFCPDRPGLGTPPCTIDKGHGDVEVGLADWTLDKSGGTRTDSWVFGDTLVRYGLTDRLEVQVGWTAYGTVREKSAGAVVSRMSGTGDVTLALRRNLVNPDGSGFSAALMPYASLPTGGRTLGAGTWSAGILLPVSYSLPHGFALSFTGRIEAAADADRQGRHLAYGAIAGLDIPLGEKLSATVELSGQRDQDPGGHATEVLAGLSFAYTASPDLQLDAGANAGLSRSAADAELYVGIARRF
ncbi:MAG: transporter [Alphaproteobacteria bacterium]|nr:transporter [Alphaproteobacteria bacterium]